MGKTSSRKDAESRAERKFEKKLQFYAKIRDTVASLNAQKSITKKKLRSRQKKLKAYDLSSLSEFLPELKSSQQKAPVEIKVNSKTRQNLVLKEGNQLKTVINHPAFQADPLGAEGILSEVVKCVGDLKDHQGKSTLLGKRASK